MHVQKYLFVLTTGLINSVWLGLFLSQCTVLVLVFRWLCRQKEKKKKERLRLSKPLRSTGSHHTADPNHCSRLAHIWGLNEANDLKQATGELFWRPQDKWKCPKAPGFHSSLYTFNSYHWCGKLWKFNCLGEGVGFGIFCPDKRCHSSINSWIFRQTVVTLLKCHLFEVVECREDDLVTSSNQTDGSQQLQHQSLCPASTRDARSGNLHETYLKTLTWWKVKVVTQSLIRSGGKDPIMPESKKIYNLEWD